MDEYPADHGSDRYGHVEAGWRTAPPPQSLVKQGLEIKCDDCNVNVFIEETEDDGVYRFKVAHDATCPWYAAHVADL